jgi:hypothetical protein
MKFCKKILRGESRFLPFGLMDPPGALCLRSIIDVKKIYANDILPKYRQKKINMIK